NLQHVELGEEIAAGAFEIEASKSPTHGDMSFVVAEMAILDKENASVELFGEPNPVHTEVLLLTTLRESGGEYILDIDKLKRKSSEKIDYENYDEASPLWFLVRGVLKK